jgi:hypothetical protein
MRVSRSSSLVDPPRRQWPVVVRSFHAGRRAGIRGHADVNERMTLLHSFTARLYRVPEIHELIGFAYWFATGNFLSEP